MKIYIAKNGRRYIKLRNGRAKFVKGKSKNRKSYNTGFKKAKKRRSYTMAKRKTASRKKQSFLGNMNKPVVGAAGVVLYESFVSPYIPGGIVKDIGELFAGAYLSRKQGMVGATGKALVTINSYQLLSQYVGPTLKGLVSGQSQQINYFGGM